MASKASVEPDESEADARISTVFAGRNAAPKDGADFARLVFDGLGRGDAADRRIVRDQLLRPLGRKTVLLAPGPMADGVF